MCLHDLIVTELETAKSLAALLYLVERGREVEFSIDGKLYFISRDKSQQRVSLWETEEEQSFQTTEELLEKARIGEAPLLSLWRKARIETIF